MGAHTKKEDSQDNNQRSTRLPLKWTHTVPCWPSWSWSSHTCSLATVLAWKACSFSGEVTICNNELTAVQVEEKADLKHMETVGCDDLDRREMDMISTLAPCVWEPIADHPGPD